MGPKLSRIKFSTLIVAVLLFFMPWITMTCNGGPWVSQTGMQVMAGDVQKEAKALEFEKDMGVDSGGKTVDDEGSKDNPDPSVLIIIGFAFLVLATLLSGVSVISKRRTQGWAVALATVALVVIGLQSAIGLPLRQSLNESIKGLAMAQGESTASFSKEMYTTYETWLYLELLMLAMPLVLMIIAKSTDKTPKQNEPRPRPPRPRAFAPSAADLPFG